MSDKEARKCCETCGQTIRKAREVKPLTLTDEQRLTACQAVFKDRGVSRIPQPALVALALDKCEFDRKDYGRESTAMEKFVRESGHFTSHKGVGGGIELKPE